MTTRHRGACFLRCALAAALYAELQKARADSGAPEMASGAGHDCAVFANQGVPCAMIFIRNDHSSHNPHEAMDIADFAEACTLLHGMLDELMA